VHQHALQKIRKPILKNQGGGAKRGPDLAAQLLQLATLTATTPRLARTSAGAPGAQNPLEWGCLLGLQCSASARAVPVPGSYVENKMTRIASSDRSTNHIELLLRAALKSVFELCSLIASRSFSAPPNSNPQPGDRDRGSGRYVVLRARDKLISGSGDDTIKVWSTKHLGMRSHPRRPH
jgi:hypothetical protein